MEQPSIYLISDGGYLRKRGALVDAIEKALAGGGEKIRFVQLREQNIDAAKQAAVPPASDAEVIDLTKKLLPICEKHKAKLILSRRVDLVKATGCAGVHLGKNGSSIEEARAALGKNAIIGYSAHSVEKVKEIAQQGFSYALLSPIFKPFSKEIGFPPLGLKPLQEACSQTSMPIFALGGISAENAASCLQAGAKGIATISAILFAPDSSVPARAFAKICHSPAAS